MPHHAISKTGRKDGRTPKRCLEVQANRACLHLANNLQNKSVPFDRIFPTAPFTPFGLDSLTSTVSPGLQALDPRAGIRITRETMGAAAAPLCPSSWPPPALPRLSGLPPDPNGLRKYSAAAIALALCSNFRSQSALGCRCLRRHSQHPQRPRRRFSASAAAASALRSST